MGENLFNEFRICLDRSDTTRAFKIIKSKDTQSMVEDRSMDYISGLFDYLQVSGDRDFVQRALATMTEFCSPKELFVCFREQKGLYNNRLTSQVVNEALVSLVSLVSNNSRYKQLESWMSLELTRITADKQEIPDWMRSPILNLNDMLQTLPGFKGAVCKGRPVGDRELCFGLGLFEHVWLKATVEEDAFIVDASTTMDALELRQPNFQFMKQYVGLTVRGSSTSTLETKDDECELTLSHMGIGCLFYFALCEQMKPHCYPLVLKRDAIFSSILPSITALVGHKSGKVVQKGLDLIEFLTENVRQSELSEMSMDMDDFTGLMQVLLAAAQYNKVANVRKQSVSLVNSLLELFCKAHKALIIRHLLVEMKHPGVQVYLIQKFKEYMIAELKEPTPTDKEFTGSCLTPVLSLITATGSSLDLLEQNDRLMGALNLIRFCLLVDRNCDRTGVRGDVGTVREFVRVLKVCAVKESVNCDREMSKLDAGVVQPDLTQMIVENGDMPELTEAEQKTAVHVSRNAIDLIQDSVSSVEELLVHFKS